MSSYSPCISWTSACSGETACKCLGCSSIYARPSVSPDEVWGPLSSPRGVCFSEALVFWDDTSLSFHKSRPTRISNNKMAEESMMTVRRPPWPVSREKKTWHVALKFYLKMDSFDAMSRREPFLNLFRIQKFNLIYVVLRVNLQFMLIAMPQNWSELSQ